MLFGLWMDTVSAAAWTCGMLCIHAAIIRTCGRFLKEPPALTTTGKYFWIATSGIESIELRKLESQRDLLWRRAELSVVDGPDGEVFFPSIYVAKSMSAALKLGHATEFDDVADRVALGKGLRTFLVGEASKTIRELGRVNFTGNRPAG